MNENLINTVTETLLSDQTHQTTKMVVIDLATDIDLSPIPSIPKLERSKLEKRPSIFVKREAICKTDNNVLDKRYANVRSAIPKW